MVPQLFPIAIGGSPFNNKTCFGNAKGKDSCGNLGGSGSIPRTPYIMDCRAGEVGRVNFLHYLDALLA